MAKTTTKRQLQHHDPGSSLLRDASSLSAEALLLNLAAGLSSPHTGWLHTAWGGHRHVEGRYGTMYAVVAQALRCRIQVLEF